MLTKNTKVKELPGHLFKNTDKLIYISILSDDDLRYTLPIHMFVMFLMFKIIQNYLISHLFLNCFLNIKNIKINLFIKYTIFKII